MNRKLLYRKMIGVLAVLLVLFMAVGSAEENELDALELLWQSAITDANGQWAYVINADSETATILAALDNHTAQVDVPHEIDGFRVTAIGDYAFESSTLEKITLPDTVISIGDSAFQWCFSLAGITLPDSLISIGDSAFTDSGLGQITLPYSLVSIGRGAFSMCYGLTEITLPVSVTSIGSGAWRACTNLSRIEVLPGNPVFSSLNGVLFDVSTGTLHTYPGGKAGSVYTVPDGVTAIGEAAFADCYALTQIILPDSLTSIGESAFNGIQLLTEITLPESLTSIGSGAWMFCRNLSRIEVLPGNPVFSSLDGVLFDVNTGTLHTYPGGKAGSVYTVPDGVAAIGEAAFLGCDALTHVILPDSLTYIGEGAFMYCYNLVLTVVKGSYAEQYAKDNGIPYVFVKK